MRISFISFKLFLSEFFHYRLKYPSDTCQYDGEIVVRVLGSQSQQYIEDSPSSGYVDTLASSVSITNVVVP